MAISDLLPPVLRPVQAIVFDLIGTATDWHTPVAAALKAHAALHPSLSSPDRDWDDFAHQWRSGFFSYVASLAAKGEQKPIKEVYQIVLDGLLEKHDIKEWDAAEHTDLIKSWAMMQAWGDTVAGLDALRQKFAVIVLSNGSSRTLIDSNKRNGMVFDLILTSDILGHYKPNPQMYAAAASALDLEPHQICMVAAHMYDLEAAAKYGFRTIYITRHTEDVGFDRARLDAFDLVIDEGGLVELARRLGAL